MSNLLKTLFNSAPHPASRWSAWEKRLTHTVHSKGPYPLCMDVKMTRYLLRLLHLLILLLHASHKNSLLQCAFECVYQGGRFGNNVYHILYIQIGFLFGMDTKLLITVASWTALLRYGSEYEHQGCSFRWNFYHILDIQMVFLRYGYEDVCHGGCLSWNSSHTLYSWMVLSHYAREYAPQDCS